MEEVKLVYIGEALYNVSDTMCGVLIKTGTGERYDWGFVKRDLEIGKSISIKPATIQQMDKAIRNVFEGIKKDK